MAKIEIEWLDDINDNCETCGTSYAEGAVVKVNGVSALNLFPVASCCGGDNFDREEVYKRILIHLGHDVTEA